MAFQRTMSLFVIGVSLRTYLHCTAFRPGADPGFFLGGGALASCSTSKPINHIVFFFCRILVVLENRRSSQRGGGGGAHPLHPPPRSAPVGIMIFVFRSRDFKKKEGKGFLVVFCSDTTVKSPFAWTIETCFF